MAVDVGELKGKLTLEDAATKTLNGFIKNVEGLPGKLAAAFSFAAVAKFSTEALKAQSAQEAAINKLNLALANQGKFTEATSKRLQDYSKALMDSSTFADEVVLDSEAMLASFGMQEEAIIRTTKAAADFAAATGSDLPSAVGLLGKAFAGNTAMLGRYGIVVGETGTKQEKFQRALEQIEGRFSGSALAATQTFEGQMKQLGNSFGEVQEALGKLIGEMFNFGQVGGGMKSVFGMITEFFGSTLVKVLYEARAAFASFLAGLGELALKVPESLRKMLGGGEAVSNDALNAFVQGQQALASEMLNAGDAAAASSGHLQKYTNSLTPPKQAAEGLTEAQKALAKATLEMGRDLDKALAEAGKAGMTDLEQSFVDVGIKTQELSDKLSDLVAKGLDSTKAADFASKIAKVSDAMRTAAIEAQRMSVIGQTFADIDLQAKNFLQTMEAWKGIGGDLSKLTDAALMGLEENLRGMVAMGDAASPAIAKVREELEKVHAQMEANGLLTKQQAELWQQTYDSMKRAQENTDKGMLDFGDSIEEVNARADDMMKKFLDIATLAPGGLEGQTAQGLQQMAEEIAKVADLNPDARAMLNLLNQLLNIKGKVSIITPDEISRAKQMDLALQNMLTGMSLLAGVMGEGFGNVAGVIENIVSSFEAVSKEQDLVIKKQMKLQAILAAAGQIGGLIGGEAGAGISGAAGGAMMGGNLTKLLGIAGPWGSIIGGALGFIGGIFGNAKKKAEELKKKQEAAMDAFSKMFDEWKNLRTEIANKATEGVNSMIGALFDDQGKFTGEFTSAANAAAYVSDQFAVLRASGMSTVQALDALSPALEAMGKDAKKFAGTAAAPLLKLAQFSKANEKLLMFVDGLGTSASALASFGMLTQEAADRIGTDMVASVQKMQDKGLSYDQALALSADSLFKISNAAEAAHVALDANTQKLVDDAKAKGLFEGLEDPMKKLVELQGAMVVAMGQLVSLMGGQVPAAIQKMIDEFNNAHVVVNVDVTGVGAGADAGAGGTGGVAAGGGTDAGGGVGGGAKGGGSFQHGTQGLVDFGPQGTWAMLHNKEAVIPESDYNRLMAAAGKVTDARQFHVYPAPGMDEKKLAEEVARLSRSNVGGLQSQLALGYR